MTINYPLNVTVFQTEEDYKEALQAVKSKQLSVDDLQLLITYNVKQLYNSLASHFFGGKPIDTNNIYKRETLLHIVNEYYSYSSHLFNILVNNGLIGVCGRGYTFDVQRFAHDEQEYNKVINLIFIKGYGF